MATPSAECFSWPSRVISSGLFTIFFLTVVSGYVCDNHYCENQMDDVCVPVEKCDDGFIMKGASNCGCCDKCVKYIKNGDLCNPISNNVPDSVCSPGLECDFENDMTCVPMKKGCIYEQMNYDSELEAGILMVGVRRPNCDENGLYAPKQCISGSVCFCVDKSGKRIFGTAPEQDAEDMDCACSRLADGQMQLLNMDNGPFSINKDAKETKPFEFLRCLPNGNFDPMQCTYSDCFCMVDQKIASKIVPLDLKEILWCYNPDPSHPQEYFYRPCEALGYANDQVYASNSETQYLGREDWKCDLDVTFASVQCAGDMCFCADVNGNPIRDYKAKRYSQDALDMTCLCARDQQMLQDNGVAHLFCDEKGNYKPIQCRGSLCYCADENGAQIIGQDPVPIDGTGTSLNCNAVQ